MLVDNWKLDPRYVKCVFLSYKSGVKRYELWFSETRKIMVNRDVFFYETARDIFLLMTLMIHKLKKNQ